MEKTMDKAIITVVGKDTVGIIAKVCTYWTALLLPLTLTRATLLRPALLLLH